MALRPMVISGGGLTIIVLTPLLLAFAVAGRPDVVRGLLLGLMVGLLNSLLLARKLDRVIDGRDPWQNLDRTMPRNMLLRLALVFSLSGLALYMPGVHAAGLVGGIVLYMIVSLAFAGWTLSRRWREEDGIPVYES
jgi:hypothetical protein